jgi:arginyl-tRNA synthetase
LAKDLKKNPNQIAEELANKLKVESSKLKVIESVNND